MHLPPAGPLHSKLVSSPGSFEKKLMRRVEKQAGVVLNLSVPEARLPTSPNALNLEADPSGDTDGQLSSLNHNLTHHLEKSDVGTGAASVHADTPVEEYLLHTNSTDSQSKREYDHTVADGHESTILLHGSDELSSSKLSSAVRIVLLVLFITFLIVGMACAAIISFRTGEGGDEPRASNETGEGEKTTRKTGAFWAAAKERRTVRKSISSQGSKGMNFQGDGDSTANESSSPNVQRTHSKDSRKSTTSYSMRRSLSTGSSKADRSRQGALEKATSSRSPYKEPVSRRSMSQSATGNRMSSDGSGSDDMSRPP